MRLKNETQYDSDDLRNIIEAACKVTTTDPPRLVEVVYNRKVNSGWHGGWAWPRSKRLKLTVPRPPKIDVRQFAQTVEHELAHLRGIDHKHMSDDILHCKQSVLWADQMVVRVVEIPQIAAVLLHPEEAARRRREGQAKAAEKREARVRAALAKAEARLARLERSVGKLRHKANYYDRKMAARPSGLAR